MEEFPKVRDSNDAIMTNTSTAAWFGFAVGHTSSAVEGRGRRPSSVVPSFCEWGQWDNEEGVLVRVEVSIWMNNNPVVALAGGLHGADPCVGGQTGLQ